MTVTWRETITVQSDDIDFNSIIRWSSLLSLMQRAADNHIEALGVSREQLVEQGMGWMIISLEVEMNNLPHYTDTIEISTWSRGSKGALWYRDYHFRNEDEIGTARSVWALVDIHKRKILRPSAFPYEVPIHTESVGEPLDKAIIPEGMQLDYAYSHTVRYSGIDSNGHLNNARYADLCWDTLTADELTKDVAKLKVTYHKEARMNDVITVKRSVGENNTIYIQGLSDEGVTFFDAAIVLKKINST